MLINSKEEAGVAVEVREQNVVRDMELLRSGGIAGEFIRGETNRHSGVVEGDGVTAPVFEDAGIIRPEELIRGLTVFSGDGLRLPHKFIIDGGLEVGFTAQKLGVEEAAGFQIKIPAHQHRIAVKSARIRKVDAGDADEVLRLVNGTGQFFRHHGRESERLLKNLRVIRQHVHIPADFPPLVELRVEDGGAFQGHPFFRRRSGGRLTLAVHDREDRYLTVIFYDGFALSVLNGVLPILELDDVSRTGAGFRQSVPDIQHGIPGAARKGTKHQQQSDYSSHSNLLENQSITGPARHSPPAGEAESWG